MSDIDWTVTPVTPEPVRVNHVHKATVEGLAVTITDEGTDTSWRVEGWLANVRVSGSSYYVHRRLVDEAKAQAVAAARRLYAAGVRGEQQAPPEDGEGEQ